MPYPETPQDIEARCGTVADQSIGPFLSRPALPGAIRSLDDDELRVLLAALLYEWRGRTSAKKGS